MKKYISIVLLVALTLLLVWSIASPLGLRAAVANNKWSIEFLSYYFEESEFRQGLIIPPSSHAHAGLFMASNAMKQGNYQLALESLDPLISASDPLTLDNYAGVLYLMGNYDDALDIWITIGDDNKLNRVASNMYAVGRPDLELKAYEHQYYMNPEKYAYIVAVRLKNNNEYEKALKILETVLQDYPHSSKRASWLSTNADIHKRMQNWTEAEFTYRQSLSEMPNDYNTLANLGLLYMEELDNAVEANQYFKKLIEINPSNSNGYLLLGQSFEKFGQPEQALQAYQNALIVDPNNRTAQQALDRLSAP